MVQSIKATGVKELRRELRKMGDDLEDLKALNLDVATLVSDRAKDIVPRRTGNLADTIRPAGTKTAGRVRAGSNAYRTQVSYTSAGLHDAYSRNRSYMMR